MPEHYSSVRKTGRAPVLRAESSCRDETGPEAGVAGGGERTARGPQAERTGAAGSSVIRERTAPRKWHWSRNLKMRL